MKIRSGGQRETFVQNTQCVARLINLVVVAAEVEADCRIGIVYGNNVCCLVNFIGGIQGEHDKGLRHAVDQDRRGSIGAHVDKLLWPIRKCLFHFLHMRLYGEYPAGLNLNFHGLCQALRRSPRNSYVRRNDASIPAASRRK